MTRLSNRSVQIGLALAAALVAVGFFLVLLLAVQAIDANHVAVCHQYASNHNIITTFGQAIPLPKNTPDNAYNYSRTVIRNNQLADEVKYLLGLLGKTPSGC